MDNITAYLQAIATLTTRMPTIEGIVLAHGKQYPAPMIARPAGIRKGKDRECYRNAFLLAEFRGWQYVEGFAVSDVCPLPLQHAWVLDPDGNVIEATWQNPGTEYYGIALEIDFARLVLLETHTWGVLDYRSTAFRERFARST